MDKVVALSNGSTDMVMYKPNNSECWCLWKPIASSKQQGTKWRELDRKPKQRHLMLQQKMSTKTSGVHLPPHPHTPKLLWNCCERTHGPSVAFPSNVKWHSPASSSDVRQRDVLHGPRKVTAVASPTHIGLFDVLQKRRSICRSNQHPQLSPSCPSHHPWLAHAIN